MRALCSCSGEQNRAFSARIAFWRGTGDRYSKLKQDVEFRQAVAKKTGLGFELPAKNRVVGPNGPKIEFQSVQEMAASA